MSTLLKLALWALGLYTAYCGLLFVLQRQMLFARAHVEAPLSGTATARGLEKLWIDSDGGRVEAWYLPPAGGLSEPHAVVIFGHGNAERIDTCLAQLSALTRLGLGLLLVEYPGYGRSGGTPSERAIRRALTAAYDTIVQRPGVDPKRVILMGRSLGGGAVCQLAARRPAAALILVSTFTDTRSFARRYGAPGFLVRDPFDSLAVLGAYPGPVLIFHGRLDEIVPVAHAAALQRAAPHAEVVLYDCGHNDCPPDESAFFATIADFLQRNGLR